MEGFLGRVLIVYLLAMCLFALHRLCRASRFFRAMETETVGARFQLQSKMCSADLRLLRSLSVLTLLITAFVVIGSFGAEYGRQFNETKVTGSYALLRTLDVLFRRLASGILVSSLLYAAAAICDAILLRRMITHEYRLSVSQANANNTKS
jgi:hypothetical protein